MVVEIVLYPPKGRSLQDILREAWGKLYKGRERSRRSNEGYQPPRRGRKIREWLRRKFRHN